MTLRACLSVLSGLLLLTRGAAAQERERQPPGIQDNSFLIEESYNQEPGIVQHIQTFQRGNDGSWVASFTQEWPVPRETHQLSYTFTAARNAPEDGGSIGLGDLFLNYRYQLVGDGRAVVAVAPRLSVLLPTGSYRAGRGNGGVGLQTLVPVSVVLSPAFVVHGNAGATWVPGAKNPRGDRAGILGASFGASVVWLARNDVNLLTEAVWTREGIVTAPHRTAHTDAFFVNPGARFAINSRDGLQVVPGISVPIGVGPSRGGWSVFVYLSFEHPIQIRS